MSTTYAKIRACLAEMSKKQSWEFQALRGAMVARDKSRGEDNFHLRRVSTNRKKSLSDESFERLLNLMIDLDLLRKDKSEDFYIPDAVKHSLDDDERYKLMLSRRVTEYLEKSDVTITEIRQAADSINYPNVRDPATILEVIKRSGKAVKLNVAKFTQVLFLLACAAKRAERHMRIFYEFK
jgi:hypothetical protein